MDDFSGPDEDGAAEAEMDLQFRRLTSSLMTPHYKECLVCFLVRAVPMLEPVGFAMTRIFRDSNAPRATGLGTRLGQLGIHSDAHLLQWGVVTDEGIWEVPRCPDCGIPEGAPPCRGVRKGSTQPCELWIWRKHVLSRRFEDETDRLDGLDRRY